MIASNPSDLTHLERQVYESIWNDGLLDLCVGTALMITGVFWVTGLSIYSTFAAPIMIPVWVAARKHISQPRAGVVRFSAERVNKEKAYFLSLFLLGVVTLVAGLIWYFKGIPFGMVSSLEEFNIIAGLPALLLSVPAVVVAISLGLPRFFIYGAALITFAIPVIHLDLHPGWAFIPCAALSLSLGAVLLVRFINNHPTPD